MINARCDPIPSLKLSTVPRPNPSSFNLCAINAQCLKNKVCELEILCIEHDIDALCVCEHWLVEAEADFYSNIGSLALAARLCRSTPWGGVAIFLHPKWDFLPLDLSSFSEEIHGEFTGIILKSLSIAIVTMYHSPSGSLDRFFYLLELCLDYLISLGLFAVIATDHNVNPLTHPNEATDFKNLIRSFGFYFSVDEPTRGDSPLDTVLTNFDSWMYSVCVSRDRISDHKHILFFF